MKYKVIKLEDILKFIDSDLVGCYGPTDDVVIDNIPDTTHVNKSSLDWINPSRHNKQELAMQSPAKVLLVDESVAPIDDKVLIQVKNPKLILAKIGNYFFVEKSEPEIHHTAIIHEDAIIGNNVTIGAYCVIGKAIIGDGCVLDSNVKVYDDVTMGKGCIVKSGAVLGGAGFGYERDKDGNKFRFPQIGQLIMGDYVEVGSNTCIDRGALSDTIIGDYTKINNLCHIAHNNKIGRNVIITGCVNVSGSNVIDDDVWIAPNASIRGWIHIGAESTIGMAAVVTKNIPAGETWVGNPARKMEKR